MARSRYESEQRFKLKWYSQMQIFTKDIATKLANVASTSIISAKYAVQYPNLSRECALDCHFGLTLTKSSKKAPG